jgi:hypothetical protein
MLLFSDQIQLMASGKSEYPVTLVNGATPPIDMIALYTFLATVRPRRFVEIGSGYSTACAVNAIRTERLGSRITIVNPAADPGLSQLPEVENLYAKAVHDVPLDVFKLAPGDILYVDGSHRATMGSDVVTVFMEILPTLPPGVFVHFHDIFLPMDYWPHWDGWNFSEQYLLAVLLLFSKNRFKVHLPVRYCCEDPSLLQVLDPLKEFVSSLDHPGGSFWMESTDPTW